MRYLPIIIVICIGIFFPAFSQISASKIEGCAPLSVAFSNSLENVSKYEWHFGNGAGAAVPNPVIIYDAPGAFNVSLTVTYNNGQAETFSLPSPITIVDKATVDFNISGNEFCVFEGVKFENNTSGATGYLWDFGDGFISTETNPEHSYEKTGTYSVSLIAYNSLGCPSVKIIDHAVKINDAGEWDVKASSNTACLENATIMFSTSPDTFSSWLWDFGDGTQSTSKSPGHTYHSAGKYDLLVTVTAQNGCVDTLKKVGFVEIFDSPKIEIETSEQQICVGNSVEFTNKTLNPAAVNWSFSDGYTSHENSFVRVFEETGTYNGTVTITNSNGCTSVQNLSEEIQVLNADEPLIEVSNTSGCVPFEVHFNNTTPDAITTEWEINGLTFNEKSVAYTFQNPGAYDISVKIKHASGCYSTLVYDSYITASTTNSAINVDKYVGCVPFETSFSLSAPNATDVVWDFGNGETSSQLAPEVVYNKAGQYNVNVSFVNEYGCNEELTLDKKIIVQDTTINYTAPGPIYACHNTEVYFSGEMGKDFWLWDFGDGATSDLKNPSHVYKTPGAYTVSLTTNNHSGCTSSIPNYNQIIITDIEEVNFETTIIQGEICPEFTLQAQNLSAYTDIMWNFGDGTFSTEINPEHQYSANGQYVISLTAHDSLGCSKTTNSIITSPWLYCSASGDDDDETSIPDSVLNIKYYHTVRFCEAPSTMNFNNPKPDAKSWNWDFGDGYYSTEMNPSHTYEQTGEYYVNLIYAKTNGTVDTIASYVTVIIENALVDYNYEIESSCMGAEVSFFNTDNSLVNWEWDFGNGQVSEIKNPVIDYGNEGVYQVILDAKDSAGCVAKTVKNIVVGNPYQLFEYPGNICLGDSLKITHNVQHYKNYRWHLGDGNVTSEWQPEHLYTKVGEYTITLEAEAFNGCVDRFELPNSVTVTQPNAEFRVKGKKQGCNTLVTSFESLSPGAEKWLWDFGNGVTSEEQHPTAEFDIGEFSVQLTVWENGCPDTIAYENLIEVIPFTVDFGIKQDDICLPVAVEFRDNSVNATEWYWDFGDGNKSEEQNPVHVYTSYPSSDVKLTIKNDKGCQLNSSKPLEAFFKPNIVIDKDKVCIPDKVTFTDNSNNTKSWLWDFGDGVVAEGQTVIHEYKEPGEYLITLIAQSNSGCYDTLVASQVVKAMNVEAKFSADIADNSCSPLLVRFNNESEGATRYSWLFGDNTTSTSESPVHIYNGVGSFDVKLVANNGLGCKDEIIIDNLITTNGPEAKLSLSASEVCAPGQIEFSDLSKSAVKWEWFFGEGSSSSSQNPTFQYANPGNYVVSLLATDSLGCSEMVKSDTIKVYPVPNASFTIADYDHCMPVNIQVNNTSQQLQNESFMWDLGNDTRLEGRIPSIRYNEPGQYELMLTVINEGNCVDTFKLDDAIIVMDTTQIIEPDVFELSVLEGEQIRLIKEPYLKNNFKYNVLYRAEGDQNVFEPFDTLWQSQDTIYRDIQVNPNINSYAYRLRTFAYCQHTNDPQLSMYKSVKINTKPTEDGIEINWTPYVGHSFNHYALYRQWNSQAWEQIQELEPSQTSYIDTEDLCPGTYTYRVVANNLNQTDYKSESNFTYVEPLRNVFAEQKVQIVRSTVEDEAIFTEWKEPEIGADKVVFYRVWRSEDEQNYELIDQTPNEVTNYYDSDVDVSEKSYYYLVDIVNTCDVAGQKSNLGSSILLNKETDNYKNRIFWNPYKEWPDGVSKYLIQRKNEFGEWETVEAIPADQKEYTIDLNDN